MLNRFLRIMVLGFASLSPLWADIAAVDLSWHASDLFDAQGSDISLALLRMVFGSVGQVLSGPSNVVGEIFRLFNIGLMAVAGSFVSYTVVSNVVRTAQDGGAAGRKFSFKILLRIVGGLTLLTPGITGYSLVQVMIMSAIVFGVGLADSVWERALYFLETTTGVAYSTPTSSGYDAILALLNSAQSSNTYTADSSKPPGIGDVANTGNIMVSAYCVKTLSNYDTQQQDQADDYTSGDYKVRYGSDCQADAAFNDQVICFGSADKPTLCGGYYWGKDNTDAADAASALSIYVDQLASLAEDQVSSAYAGVRQGLSEADLNLSCSGSDYVQCAPATSLLSDTATLYQTVASLGLQEDATQYAWVDEAKAAGWASAGNYYYQLIGQTGSQNSPLIRYSSTLSLSDYQLQVLFTHATADTLHGSGFLDAEGANTFRYLANALGSQIGRARSVLLGQVQASAQTNSLYDDESYQSTMTMDLMGRIVNIIIGVFAHSCENDTDLLGNTTDTQTCVFNIGNRLNLSDSDERDTMSNVFYTDYEIGVPQNNVVVMLADVVGGFFGLQLLPSSTNDSDALMLAMYDYGMDKQYTWWEMSSACQAALTVCNPNWNTTDDEDSDTAPASNEDCYKIALNQGCIVPGVGLLGAYSLFHESVDGSSSFVFLDALSVINRIGKTLLRGGVNYFRRTIQGTLNKAWIMVGLIQTQVYWTAVAGGTAAAGLALIPDVGGAISQGAAAITNITNSIASFTFQWDLSALYYWLPLGATLAAMCTALGVLIAMFVPLLPWMMFAFSVIGWVIAVIEAMVAAPIIALGVTHPEGHDLLGRAQQSLALLLSVFVRPVAILFGFIASIGLVYVGYQLVNFGFLQVMRSFYSDINDETFMIFAMSMLGWITVYCYTAMTLVSEVFAMIYQIPEMLIRWVGGQPDQSQVRGIIGKVKSTLKESGQKGSEGASQQGSSGASMRAPSAHVSGQKGKKGKEDDTSSGSNESGGGSESSKE